jgi:hypothetical protein
MQHRIPRTLSPHSSMTSSTRIFFLLLLFGMGLHGALYLGLLLLPTSPHKAGLWFWIYTIIVPYLLILGIVGLLQRNALDLPWQIGTLILIYTLLLMAWANSFYIGFAGLVARLPGASADLVPMLLFGLTLAGIIQVMREEYYC